MPFKSEAQRRFMWAKHPEIAQRWADEMKKKHQPMKRAIKRRIKKKGK